MYYNASYIRSSLSFDEYILVYIRMHIVVWLETWLWGFATLASLYATTLPYPTIIPFIVLLIITIYKYFVVAVIEMALTNKRVIRKTGVIWVKSEELLLSRVESIEIKQTVIGRILNYGTITFSGTGTSKVKLRMVRSPRQVKREIENYFGGVLAVRAQQ
ncbi:MAG: PH domain-containing protein [Lactobacillaceae bacterium]|nr:PH domain-containing protein [Lactobacillaceae bacterium]